MIWLSVTDACPIVHIWLLNPGDASWLRDSGVRLIVPDTVEGELRGQGERRSRPAQRSLPGVQGLSLLETWGVTDQKRYDLEFSDLERVHNLRVRYKIGQGEATAIAVGEKLDLPVLTNDQAALEAVKAELGAEKGVTLLALVLRAFKKGLVDRHWISMASRRLAANYESAALWPRDLEQYANTLRLTW